MRTSKRVQEVHTYEEGKVIIVLKKRVDTPYVAQTLIMKPCRVGNVSDVSDTSVVCIFKNLLRVVMSCQY